MSFPRQGKGRPFPRQGKRRQTCTSQEYCTERVSANNGMNSGWQASVEPPFEAIKLG